MRKIFPIADYKIDEYLEQNKSEDYHWDENTIIVNGVPMTRESVVDAMPKTKTTASSIIKKDPQFDFSFMNEFYLRMDQLGIDHIQYAHVTNEQNGTDNHRFQLDIHAAYPHIIQFCRMPVDGALYMEEDPDRLNFYLYEGTALFNHCIITDDLKAYVEEHDLGTCEFMFSTDYCIGCNMGKKMMEMCYKNKRTKEEVHDIHWGYYQKKFLEYIDDEDCYAMRTQYNKEPLMVAIISELVYIMLNVRDIIGDYNGYFNVDAYYFDKEPDVEDIKTRMSAMFEHFDYRIIDTTQKATEDKHGGILYKSYPDLPDAPRSHHKKKDFEVVYPVAKEAKIW